MFQPAKIATLETEIVPPDLLNDKIAPRGDFAPLKATALNVYV